MKLMLLLSQLLCLALIVVACNNPKEPENNVAKTDASVKQATTVIQERIFALYLTEDEFRDLVNSNNPNEAGGKLNFQFGLPDVNQSPFKLTLVVWPFKNMQYHSNKKYLHNELTQWPLNLNRGDILGGQKMKNEKVALVLTALDNTAGTDNVVAFEPVRNNNRITFRVHVYPNLNTLKSAQKAILNPITSLNPSPPASDNPDQD